jgi:hypothetical protein
MAIPRVKPNKNHIDLKAMAGRPKRSMELPDLIVNAISQLLIENMTMKQLLKEHEDLAGALCRAKSDPMIREIVESRVAPLRTAIRYEVEFERIFQDILDNPPPTKGLA